MLHDKFLTFDLSLGFPEKQNQYDCIEQYVLYDSINGWIYHKELDNIVMEVDKFWDLHSASCIGYSPSLNLRV